MAKVLSQAGKEDLAFALILLKDFKSQGRLDLELSKVITELALELGVLEEFQVLLAKVPRMLIKPREVK